MNINARSNSFDELDFMLLETDDGDVLSPSSQIEKLILEHPAYAHDIQDEYARTLLEKNADNNRGVGSPNTRDILRIFDAQIQSAANIDGLESLTNTLQELRQDAEHLLTGEYRVPYRIARLVAELATALQKSVGMSSSDVLRHAHVMRSEFSQLHAELPKRPRRKEMHNKLGGSKNRLTPNNPLEQVIAYV